MVGEELCRERLLRREHNEGNRVRVTASVLRRALQSNLLQRRCARAFTLAVEED